MKVAIYARKSNEQDDVAIRSVDAQITECKQLAVANGWTIGNTFIDDNVSGGTWKRPGLDALFASLDGIDVVLVEEQKALARDYRLLTLIAKPSKHENAKQPHWAQARSSCWGTRSPPL